MVDDELEPLITRCPNCNTQFRVTENQLAVASGRVRCGACLTVFQGIEHLILDDGTPPFTTGIEADAALDELLDELEPGASLQIDGEPALPAGSGTGAVHPLRAPDDGTRLYGGFEDVAQTREVERVESEAVDRADGVDAVPDDVQLPHADGVEAIDDAEEADAAVDDDVHRFEGVEASDAPADTEEDYERWIDRSSANIDQLVEEVVASGRAAARGRSAAPVAATVVAEPEHEPAAATDGAASASLASAAREISFAPEPRRWWAGAVAALFVLLLVVQVAYLQLPEWSREPSLRPAYELVCGLLGCELPEMRALDALRTRNLVVRSHPATNGALIVDAAIVNTARFAQRYPDLELRFTSVTGELVAGRRFSPDEYLPGDFEGERSMPPDTPVQVSLEIVDPGPDAVNYTLSFR